jgi:hypothetical protein
VIAEVVEGVSRSSVQLLSLMVPGPSPVHLQLEAVPPGTVATLH